VCCTLPYPSAHSSVSFAHTHKNVPEGVLREDTKDVPFSHLKARLSTTGYGLVLLE